MSAPQSRRLLIVLMPKTHPLHTGAKSNLRDRVLGEIEKNSFIALNLRDRVLGEIEKNSFIALSGKEGRKLCVSIMEDLVRSCYSNDGRIGLLRRIKCVQGLHSFILISGDFLKCFSGSFNLASDGLLWNEKC